MKSTTLQTFNRLAQYILKKEESDPVTKIPDSSELSKKIDLSLKKLSVQDDELENILKDIIDYTPRTTTSLFFSQLFGGRNDKAVLGDLLAVLLNNSQYTYKCSGVHTLIENELVNNICKIINYPEKSGGAITPGGSMSNLMAMLMARDNADPNIRSKGYTKKMIFYTSEASHYSFIKNASFMGLGKDNARHINTDERGIMDVQELEQKIKSDLQQGHTPFMINATAGTTVLGAFDSIKNISKIAKEYGIWLHVDGAYGGSVIFSDRYRHLIESIEASDSFSINPHKMLNTPLSCSLILVKDKKNLYHSFSNDAEYLFHGDDAVNDLGQISLQCGKRNDALKFWTLWKSVGTEGLSKIIDHHFQLANIAREYVKNHDNYTLYSFDDSPAICFNYKDICPKKLSNELHLKGKILVSYGTVKGMGFVRLVTVNNKSKEENVLDFFKVIEEFIQDNMEVLKKEP